jgi:integrase
MPHKNPPRRRPKGTGGIYALGPKRFRAVVIVNGKRRSKVCATNSDATTWINQKSTELHREGKEANPRLRLRDLAEEYERELKRLGRTVSTREQHASHVNAVLARWGDLRLEDLTVPRLNRMMAEMDALGWASATVRNRIDRVTGMLRMAMELGYIEQRGLRIRRPRVTIASRPDPYSPDEVAAVLEVAEEREDPRYLAAIELAGNAGLRAGELLRFRRCDLLDLKRLVLVPVRGEDDRPKSGEERQIPVPRSVVEAVQACPATGDDLVINVDRWKSGGSLRDWLRPLWLDAGVEGRPRLHRLRHWWATRLANAGAHPMELMAWGGWTSMAVVRRYFHGPDVARRGVVDSLDSSRIVPRLNADAC